jgi:hypothetical protein
MDGTGRRNAVCRHLDELAAAVDAGEVSHVRLFVSVVVPEGRADALTARAQNAGATSSDTPLG